jgi:hypothetical protein
MTEKEIIEARIEEWKDHMRDSHDLYFTDPYGRDADLLHLQRLQRQLKERGT